MEKNEWPPNSRDLKQWIIMCGPDAGTLQKYTPKAQNRPTLPSWRLPCYRCVTICHGSSLVRQSCHFERARLRSCVTADGWHFEHSIQFKYREGSWHSSLKRLNCWRKCRVRFAGGGGCGGPTPAGKTAIPAGEHIQKCSRGRILTPALNYGDNRSASRWEIF